MAGVVLAALSGCATPDLQSQSSAPTAPAASLPVQPEIATGVGQRQLQRFGQMAVAAANPLAAAAGLAMLDAGGNAMDAAVAVQAVLALVEPQSSGLGGGAFLLHWDGATVSAWDGRETAPAAVDERWFLQPDGRPMPRDLAVRSGRSVGVPGVMRMLQAAHRRHGRLPWAQLFQPAIQLAAEGVPIGERLHRQLAAAPSLRQDALARALYFDAHGQPWPAGTRRPNPAMAAVLGQLAAAGADAMHQGPIAADMVQRVRGHERPGALALTDLADYQALERQPLCSPWRQWRICGMPPPSSGALAIAQILGLVDLAGAGQAAAPAASDLRQPAALHRYLEASRLAFADRARYVADPDRVAAPGGRWDSLLAPEYLQQRARLMGPRSMGQAGAGEPGPPRDPAHAWAPQRPQPEQGTSHVSIVDREGRAVAFTTSIEAAFGAQIMSDGGTGLAGGFLLNNQLTDFAFEPRDADGRAVANRPEPGKRPRSSMSPTLVFERGSGRLLAVAGSPGGAFIIPFTAKVLLGMLGEGLDPQAAIERPNAGNFNGPTVLERGRFGRDMVDDLVARGHAVREVDLPSGLQVLLRDGPTWLGGADPRREGVVLGR